MGAVLRTCFLLGCIYLIHPVYGQLVDMGQPVSWKEKDMGTNKSSVIVLPEVDMDRIRKEDVKNDQDKSIPWRFAYNFEVDYSLENSGEWTDLPNGDRIWRLTIYAPGALSLNVVFSDFFIAEGAYLYMYNNDRSHLVGAYTSILNNPDRILGTELVEGEMMTMEYYEPKGIKGKSSLQIETIAHGYRSLVAYAKEIIKGLNDSGACNHDVRCPLGVGWEDQIRSVGLIIVGGNSGCSGALINNTRSDGHPYFLTANHCLGNPANWVFRFHWDSPEPSCATTSQSANGPFMQTAFNSRLIANASRSDFALVELNNNIPEEWEVYYSGWDRTDIPPDFVIGIHHPRGDIKKICRDDDPPYHATSSGAQVWWLDQWEDGVTEPGSSGSPLFDHNGRIIGQLFGGQAACSTNPPTQNNGLYDFYGRFAVSWDGPTPQTRLKDWLDPHGVNVEILDGYDPTLFQFANDLELLSIGSFSSTSCDTETLITPSIRNRGIEDLTFFTFIVTLNDSMADTLLWEGLLLPGDTLHLDNILLQLEPGNNQIIVSAIDPNGEEDGNPLNNTIVQDIFAFEEAEIIQLTIVTDCWGSETTWDIRNANDDIIYSGGPFSDAPFGETHELELCLSVDCYVFNIYDSFGDGMNGSQYFSCSVDGNYFMTNVDGEVIFEMTAENAAFGSQASHEFCVEEVMFLPGFTADTTSICSGNTVEFQDISTGGITTRLWSFPGGSPQVSTERNPSVFYHILGTYDVILYVSNGVEEDSVLMQNLIQVLPSPDISIDLLDSIVCHGDCTGRLEASAEKLSELDLIWSNGAVTSQIDSLCGNTTYTLTATNEDGCSAEAAFELTEPEPLTFDITTIPASCIADDGCASIVGLDDPEQYNIIWMNGSSELEICGLAAGVYSITIESEVGCISEAEGTIGQSEPPVLTADVFREGCLGECDGEIYLQIEGQGTHTFHWSEGLDSTDVQSGLCSGNYMVLVRNEAGCEVELELTIEPGDTIPIVQFEPSTYDLNLAIDSIITFVNTSSHTVEYLWDFGDGTSSQEFEPTHMYTDTGVYTVILTAINEFCHRSDTAYITVSYSVSTLDQQLQNKVLLYPNPSRGEVFIELNDLLVLNPVRVMDVHGRSWLQASANHLETLRINVSGLTPGVYFVSIETHLGRVMKKLVIHP